MLHFVMVMPQRKYRFVKDLRYENGKRIKLNTFS